MGYAHGGSAIVDGISSLGSRYYFGFRPLARVRLYLPHLSDWPPEWLGPWRGAAVAIPGKKGREEPREL